MRSRRRNLLVYSLLAGVWAIVLIWQAEEHGRVRQAAQADLGNRSRDIANTVSACIRGMKFRGAVFQERLESVLEELVSSPTNTLLRSSDLLSIALLNASGEPVATSGRPIDFAQREILQNGERWGQRAVTFVHTVDLGTTATSSGASNPVVVLPPMRAFTNGLPERGHEEPPAPAALGHDPPGPPPPPARPPRERGRENESRTRRPPWLRNLSDHDFQMLLAQRQLHGLVLSLSTDSFHAAMRRDLWLRAMIALLSMVSVAGVGLAWRSLTTSADLQIRLVRASELNTHLKEMNLAAAGLAHETRNPLNIIRGLAQLVSRRPEACAETRESARQIIVEADKVTAQLTEFINYSKPREVRRAAVALPGVVSEVARALSFDLEEKNIHLEIQGDPVRVEADEQLLRQALFNLLLNATQVLPRDGTIEVVTRRSGLDEATLELRDNGPGVAPEVRREIFKPYFTMKQQGTGLGLAIVQQIVQAHGWEIECAPNQPKGAIFRISRLKLLTGTKESPT